MTPEELTQLAAGSTVSRIRASPGGGLTIHFAGGTAIDLVVEAAGVGATFRSQPSRGTLGRGKDEPTARQREYLAFIQRYMGRYGVSPAENDILEHFMVSAPSVNAMIRTLERRGFISRGRDLWGQTVPRSIRVLIDLT